MSSKKKLIGVPTELSSRIDTLANYLKHLPVDIPLNPTTSSYQFGLEPDHIAEEGYFFAANKNLESCFETWKKPKDWDGSLEITERGKRLEDLVKMLRVALKNETDAGSQKFLVDKWVERLISVAKRLGVKIPSKRKIVESDSESDTGITSLQKPTISSVNKKVTQKRRLNPNATTPKDPVVIELSDDERPITKSTLKPQDTCEPKSRPLKQASLMNWAQKFTPEELKAQRDLINEKREEYAEKETLRQERMKEMKKAKVREQTKARVAKHRAQKKAAAGKHGQKSAGRKAKKELVGAMSSTKEVKDLAEISRPKGAGWRKSRTGKRGGVIQKRHSRINWYHPLLWYHIAKLAPSYWFSAHLLAKALHREHPELFQRLTKGTIQHWLSKNGNGWSKKTLRNVERHSAITASGRVGILTPYPDLVKTIKEKLIGLRKSGISVNRGLARSIMLAVIKSKKPELLADGRFKCTEQYVGGFLDSVLSWSTRSGTRAAAHIPEDAPEFMERTFYRLVHLITYYDIPPGLLINMDQTGIMVLLTRGRTWDEKGARQVDIHGTDEKRAYTLCVASSADGDFLPFQQVWSGKSARSIPSKEALGYWDARDAGFDFEWADSKKATSHFSTLKTMKEWMVQILRPYIEQYIKHHELPPDQKAILYIDCYPVHTGLDFRTYVLQEFPNVFLVFVPANCTAVGQPADVGLQRVVKHHIRQDNLQWLVDKHMAGLSEGLTPSQIKFTTSLPVLRDAASIQPCVNVFEFFQTLEGRKLVQKAWQNCIIRGGFNLSGDCLTHRDTKAALRKYLADHADFREEIEAKIGRFDYGDKIPGDSTNTDDGEMADDDEIDATDVPLEFVIRDALGVHVNLNRSVEFTVDNVEQDPEVGTWGAGDAMHENILLYREDGDSHLTIDDFVEGEPEIWYHTSFRPNTEQKALMDPNNVRHVIDATLNKMKSIGFSDSLERSTVQLLTSIQTPALGKFKNLPTSTTYVWISQRKECPLKKEQGKKDHVLLDSYTNIHLLLALVSLPSSGSLSTPLLSPFPALPQPTSPSQAQPYIYFQHS
ncbi:hypothetical protein K435DRAFT_835856 [Dendrothele bispora CBS 962.96]|uniref:DDE-1 domain-containing protein n=1 Tax=Dendrothele bispora (strain CBS 962.96) TaxID=1314807 RepID=A0A4S8MKQ3_DENBC|nr:hypothetical protein K435DRAFT_835856 [Dendrothele bispora CBS 962.96]